MAKKKKPSSQSNSYQRQKFRKDTAISKVWDVIIILLTIGLTKTCDHFFPSKLSISEIPTETVVVEHKFDFGEAESDSVLNMRLQNLAKVEELESKAKKHSNVNKMLLDNVCSKAKGYSSGNASAFCDVSVLSDTDNFINIRLHFFEASIVEKVAFVGFKVFRVDPSSGKQYYVMDLMYEPQNDNLMKLSPTLKSGTYVFSVGFTLKKDISETYPTFYSIEKQISIRQ